MIYVFTFLGEFGYEILNWQGVIRKFSTKIDREKDKIICCTRKGLEPFYEFADNYIDISELSYFKNSVANMYWAHNPDVNIYKHYDDVINNHIPSELLSKKDLKYQHKLKKQIRNLVLKKLKHNFFQNIFITKFIFSSDYQVIKGLEFGTKSMNIAKIYADLNLNNNKFIKIKPQSLSTRKIEKKLGFELTQDYILCQDASRSVVTRSKNLIDSNQIIKDLAKHIKVVLLNFDTGRNLDSNSKFANIDNCIIYNCSSFVEQSVLIYNSKSCVFFTEGDFRSHNYLPPFIGKDVYSIANKTVFNIGTTPIDFWNNNVFKFGGQIIPIIYEDLTNTNNYNELIQRLYE